MTDQTLTLRTALADFTAFLRSPQVLAPEGLRAPGNFRRWAWLTLLLVGVLIGVLLPLLKLWQMLFNLPDPDAFDAFPKEWLVPAVVLFAPLSEELLFRGWQSGSRAALWLLLCALVGLLALAAAITSDHAIGGVLAIAAALAAAAIGWWFLRRKRGPMRWFARIFPLVFYGVAALFALAHLGNYAKVSLIAVPLVAPQLWAGLVLGHIRQRIGLIGSIAAHAVSNGITVALALAFG